MGYKSDIEIAQETEMQPISEIAKTAGIDEKYLEHYGKYKAKIDYNMLKAVSYTHLSQPRLVPVSPARFRMTSNKVSSSSTENCFSEPFNCKVMVIVLDSMAFPRKFEMCIRDRYRPGGPKGRGGAGGKT